MSIWKDKRGDYHVSLQHRGRRVHRELPKGSSQEDARRLETKLRKELFRVIDLGEAPSVTCLQAVQRYLDEEVVHQKAAHITRLKAYSMESNLSGRPLAEIHTVAEEMVSAKGSLAAATVNRKLSILKRTAALAYRKWGWLREPLHERITKIPGEKSRHVYLSVAQINDLVRRCERQETKDAVVLAAYTGLRTGELYALTSESFRDNTFYLPDSKSNAPRGVPVIPKVRAAAKRWVAGRQYHRRTMYADYEQARMNVLPDLTFHDLRHTCASLLAQAGVDLYTIGQILGHKSTQTTARYAHLSMDAKRKALRKIG